MPQQISVVGCNIVDEEGIFKATVLWDKIVTYLEESIKCGRHTQSLKTYTNCFQGSKAVECLLVHLNAVQPKPVKRCQVQTLCQKLVLTGVIEDVKDKGVFREGRLYRLTRNHFWANPTEVSISIHVDMTDSKKIERFKWGRGRGIIRPGGYLVEMVIWWKCSMWWFGG